MGRYFLRFPSVHGKQIFFISNNTLFQGEIEGGTPVPLFNCQSGLTHSRVSPDGKKIVFVSSLEGPNELYLLELKNGNVTRLTFHPSGKHFAGWSLDSEAVYFSSGMEGEGRLESLFKLPLSGGYPENLHLGEMNHIHFDPKKEGRFVTAKGYIDPSQWKGYRGGRTGKITLFEKGKNSVLLTAEKAPQVQPYLHHNRVYFISDRDGIGNLYSMNLNGKEIKAHTHYQDFYIRNLNYGSGLFSFQKGGDLFIFDPLTEKISSPEFEIPGYGPQRDFYFPDVEPYIQGIDLSPSGKKMILNSRGRLHTLPNWEGTPREWGHKEGVRFRLSQHLGEDKIVSITDEGGEERIVLFDLKTEKPDFLTPKPPGGRFDNLVTSHDEKTLLFSHQNRLISLDIKSKKQKVLVESPFGPIGNFDFSPDDQYVCFVKPEQENYSIWLLTLKTGKSVNVSGTEWEDYSPRFDSEGRFLYFLSQRYLDPYRDQLDHDYGYPNTLKPYLVVLNQKNPSPFTRSGRSFYKKLHETTVKEKSSKKGKKKKKITVDFEGIQNRIFELPLPAKPYNFLFQRENRLFCVSSPLLGLMGHPDIFDLSTKGDKTLEYFDLLSGEWHCFSRELMGVDDSARSDFILLKKKQGIRVVNCVTLSEEKSLDRGGTTLLGGRENFCESSGWVDLSRVHLSVNLKAEWKQIFIEAWRLGRDYFWRADMDGADWEKVKKLYLPLVDRISTRQDLQDLLWQLYGEMRTSHAYVMGGDFPSDEFFNIGLLGCDFKWDPTKKGFRFQKIYQGDSFIEGHYSPLLNPGISIQEGDVLLKVNGEPVTENKPPHSLLLRKGGKEVSLEIFRKKTKKKEKVEVQALKGEMQVRYRDWVSANKNYVGKKSSQKMGYIHLPNMHLAGINEFTRSFFPQLYKKGLIIDVRNNGGGHVSQIIISKLKRHLIGMSHSRWHGQRSDPPNTFMGPLVALCNENTGSDGDIFCVSFKDLKMGPLIGTRTWGGVIGIMPRMKAVDNTVFTQPEFATWFPKQGYRVENHGADPDVWVDLTPEDHQNGQDPQLDKAILLLEELIQTWTYPVPSPLELDPPAFKKR